MRTEYFTSKSKAQSFAQQNPDAKFEDFGTGRPRGKRWAVKIREPRGSKAKAARNATKKDKAVEIVNKELSKGKSRQEILQLLEDKVELSHQGASTYYYNIKSGLWH